jgi:uncharacterized protein YbaP (TraB family)
MCFKLPRKKYRKKPVYRFFLLLLLSFLTTVEAAENYGYQSGEADRSVFWSIEKEGQPAGFVLGTIHSEDPRVLDFTEDFLKKLKSNSIFAMEMVPDLPTLARLTEYMHLPPDQSLETVIGKTRFEALKTAMSAYSVPTDFVSRMKPWAAMMTLSTPPPETGFFMDLSLSLRASGSGLKVIGLETLEQQLSFLQDMPMPMQLDLLDQAIDEAGRVKDAHDQMVAVYLENDLVQLEAMTNEEFETVGPEAKTYFFEAGIVKRNYRMLDSLLHQLENHRVFVAVGALHLPGEEGLLELLRRNGYVLSPLKMPFIPE